MEGNTSNRVVVHFLDGTLKKGTTVDFFPDRPTFHLVVGDSRQEVRCKDLKAIFFVKDLKGDSRRRDAIGFGVEPPGGGKGKKIAVRFKDGELLCGYTLAFSRERAGFFVVPADPANNNLRVYVLSHAVTEVEAGAAAEALARHSPKPKAA
ncbi:MAG: hypothetical protein HZC42_03030 [Candidatus Eisenbacteria bacterium]|nr:hypothetical protein [Candidatus Eisenbacteria bacterium]